MSLKSLSIGNYLEDILFPEKIKNEVGGTYVAERISIAKTNGQHALFQAEREMVKGLECYLNRIKSRNHKRTSEIRIKRHILKNNLQSALNISAIIVEKNTAHRYYKNTKPLLYMYFIFLFYSTCLEWLVVVVIYQKITL